MIYAAIRAAATLFFGLGTVFWYTSMLGTTWYFAHVVAVGLTIVALGVALRRDPDALDEALGAVPGRDRARLEGSLGRRRGPR